MGKKKEAKKKDKKARADDAIRKVSAIAGFVSAAFSDRERAEPAPTRDLFSSIHTRRSHKRFKPAELDREQIIVLLEAAVRAPNHKLTEPWGFIVLGPQAKRAYAEARARLKFGGDGAAPEKVLQAMNETTAIPVIIAVTQRLDEEPVRREEDYAAVFMAIQNLLLAATAMGLGTKVHTGGILDDGWLRDALHINDRERVVAYVDVGEPADELPPKKRIPAAEKTRWLP